MKKLLPKENKEDIWKTGIGRHCSLDYWKKEEKENTQVATPGELVASSNSKNKKCKIFHANTW